MEKLKKLRKKVIIIGNHGKSYNFIKERLAQGLLDLDFLPNAKWHTLELSSAYGINENIVTEMKAGNPFVTVAIIEGNEKKVKILTYYDPDADFEYVTYERCKCDGTFLFLNSISKQLIKKIITGSTCNKTKVSENDIEKLKNGELSIVYTVGDIIQVEEYSEEFGTKEKPWMTARFSALLPLKFDLIPNEE